MTRTIDPIQLAKNAHETAIDQADNMGGLAASLEAYEQNLYDTITEKGGTWDDGARAAGEWRRLEAERQAMPATFAEADARWSHLYPTT